MALNGSGPISLAGNTAGQSIALELGLGTTTEISLNQAAVRTLANVPSGAIVMPTNFYGKSNRATISSTFTTNTTNASLNVATIGGYLSGASDITVTVNAGVYLYATATGNYGLNLTGGTTGDTVTLVNNGFILGQGGVGRNVAGNNGLVGGPALNVGIGVNITVNNTNGSAYIAGGGGSGGCGAFGRPSGGGAGGGAGGSSLSGNGGAGGGVGASGSDGTTVTYSDCCGTQYAYGGGGGGRVLPGTGGAGGTGGAASGPTRNGKGGGAGGGSIFGNTNGAAGGSANAVGANGSGTPGILPGGGGGGWGAAGGSGQSTSGGAGGKAVNLNGKSVTWVSGNTTRVYGAVS
jgi:hypothetical protein